MLWIRITGYRIFYIQYNLMGYIDYLSVLFSQALTPPKIKLAMGTKLNERDLEIYKKIDEILFFEWDPIGISDDLEWARDEYYSYLPEIFSLKKSGAAIEEIAQALINIEKDHIGMPGTVESCRFIAKKIENI